MRRLVADISRENETLRSRLLQSNCEEIIAEAIQEGQAAQLAQNETAGQNLPAHGGPQQ